MNTNRQNGYTYIGILVLIAILGFMLATAGEVWRTVQQREKERELLFVGDQFRRALGQYYRNGQTGRYPQRLEDLLRDPRYPITQRYLRKIYQDPMTNSKDWGLVRGPGGEIYGVHSLSEAVPLKTGGFHLPDKGFEGKTKYSEWLFMQSTQ